MEILCAGIDLNVGASGISFLRVKAPESIPPSPSVEQLTSLLGRDTNSPEYLAVAKLFGEPERFAQLPQFANWQKRDLELAFDPDGKIKAVTLGHSYEGPCPAGLRFSYDQSAVEKKLGPPPSGKPGDYRQQGLAIEFLPNVGVWRIAIVPKE